MSETLDKKLTRRQFLKWSAFVGTAITGFSWGGCSLPAINPRPLKGQKVQPPGKGCLYGIGNPTWVNLNMYEYDLGKRPAVANTMFRIENWKHSSYRQKRHAEYVKTGVIPHLQVGVGSPNKVVKGLLDDEFKRLSDSMYIQGRQYGGFFFTPMWEMNLNKKWGYPWCGEPNGFKDAWRHIWHLFEDQGTNFYATWTPEYYVDFPLKGYYPGDRYVDWIAFSAYNRRRSFDLHGYRYLDTLIDNAYNHFAVKEKYYMIAEMGTTTGWQQSQWLRKAYSVIMKRPNIKAALYWDNINTSIGDDHRLLEDGINTLNEILRDPYFVGTANLQP